MLVGNADNALDVLTWLASTVHAEQVDGPPFKGGWIGYLSYDLGRCFENLPKRAAADLRWPLFAFTWHENIVAHVMLCM